MVIGDRDLASLTTVLLCFYFYRVSASAFIICVCGGFCVNVEVNVEC